QRTYDIPMSPLVAAGLVEKLAEAGLLAADEGAPHTYRIVARAADVASFDEQGAEALLAEFAAFASDSLDRVGLGQEADLLHSAFLQRLTSVVSQKFVEL